MTNQTPGPHARAERLTLTDYLARLGGARPDIIEDAPGDKPRFVQLGIVILTTAGIAGISAGFALGIVGLPLGAAIPIAIGWAFAILNLDRLLIVSMPYQETRRKSLTIGLAIPRVVLALIIGIVISTPMTLAIFDKEIQPMLTVLQSEKDAEFDAELASNASYAKIPDLETQLAAQQAIVANEGIIDLMQDPAYKEAKAAYDAALAAYTAAEATWEAELNGSGGTGVAGSGPVAEQKRIAKEVAQTALTAATDNLATAKTNAETNLGNSSSAAATNAQAEVTRIQTELDGLRTERDGKIAEHAAEQDSSDGLLAKLEALDRISSRSWLMWAAHAAIALLFIAIELLPVLIKTITNLGKPTAYDRLVSVQDESLVARGEVVAEGRLAATRADVDSDVKVAQHRADLQRVEGEKLNEVVVRHQSAAVKAALAVWARYAKKRTAEKVHEYAQDLGGDVDADDGAATPGFDSPSRSGFRPTAAPAATTYSASLGFPDPDSP